MLGGLRLHDLHMRMMEKAVRSQDIDVVGGGEGILYPGENDAPMRYDLTCFALLMVAQPSKLPVLEPQTLLQRTAASHRKSYLINISLPQQAGKAHSILVCAP